MSSELPEYIEFGAYTKRVPQSIPLAVRQATDRFATGRAARVAELPDWENLRQTASDLRLHTIENMDEYLQRFEEKLKAASGMVHWAKTAEDARRIVLDIARRRDVKRAVKAKSMATEEIGLNRALQDAGIEVMETDLGEFIIQLAGTPPSHIVLPALHLKKEEIAALFREKLNVETSADPFELARIASGILRNKFLQADMGVSGANFLVAETGTLVMVTNEGNGRLCVSLPDLHVAVVGIDKIVPDWESLTVFLKLLARSATGQKLSAYTQFITGPRSADESARPGELHVVLLDNGRTRILKDPVGRLTLKCIRCGSCANICPVYKNVGGFAYGWFISGPIGAIFAPQMLGTRVARELPYASTLCGACADVCPVKVPIPSILRHLRRRVAQGDEFAAPAMPLLLRVVAAFTSVVLARPLIYQMGSRFAPLLNLFFGRRGWIRGLPYPFSRWTGIRPLPAFSSGFRKWWSRNRASIKGGFLR